METTKKSLLKSYFSALRYLLIILMFKLRAKIRKRKKKKIVRGKRNDRIFVNYLNVQIARENSKEIEKKLYGGDEMIEY